MVKAVNVVSEKKVESSESVSMNDLNQFLIDLNDAKYLIDKLIKSDVHKDANRKVDEYFNLNIGGKR